MSLLKNFWPTTKSNAVNLRGHNNDSADDNPLVALTVIDDKFYRYVMGMNSLVNEPLNSLETSVLRELDKLINQKKVASLIPRLPEVIPKIMQQLRAKNYASKPISELICKDPVLTAEVIRLVNSPYFNAGNKLEDLHQAVTYLGQRGLSELMMAVAMKPIMQTDKGFFHQQAASLTWSQALKTAVACRNLAKESELNPFEAYLCGLMHNTGLMIILRQLDKVPELLQAPHSLAFQNRSEKFTAQMSHIIACEWDLPTNVLSALVERINSPVQKPRTQLSEVLQLGVGIARMHTLADVGRYKDAEDTLELFSMQNCGGASTRVYDKLLST